MPAAGDRHSDTSGNASRHSHRAELRPRDRRRIASRRCRRGHRRQPARGGRRVSRHAVVPAVWQRRPDRRPGGRGGEERDRHRGRRGDRRRARRECPRRIDHPRPGGAGANGRGARRPCGDGDGPVGAGRSAANLHRRCQPQLQPGHGAGSWRGAHRRAGGPQLAGVATAPALVARAQGVDMPVCVAVASLLAGRTTLAEAIAALLARPRRDE